MKDPRTREMLLAEISVLRQRVGQLEFSEAELKRTEKALRQSEERFRGLTERNFDLIYELDLEGRIVYQSAAAARLAGGHPERMMGRFFYEGLPEADRIKGLQALETLKKGESIQGLQLGVINGGGEVASWEFNVSPIFEDGRVVGIEGVGKDVTERKRAEEKAREVETLKEIDRLRTELLANVSHELRTPLATIKGYATMLLNYESRLQLDSRRQYVRSIDSAADQLMGLINQLLEMSRLEAGITRLNRAPTNICELIQGTVSESQVRAPGHRLVLDLPKSAPIMDIDAKSIRQVLDNLIDNATKYSPSGTSVTIRARRESRNLVISVADQGRGIAPEHLERVFERMYRVESEQGSDHVSGIGLGLAICKGLVEGHGGRIWMESEPGKGSSCSFTLPLYPGKPGARRKGDKSGRIR